jgi:hypothetical protein
MATNNHRSSQIKQRTNLKQLGQVADKYLSEVLDAVDQELESPLKMAATFPVANAVLNFASSSIASADSAKEVVSPVKKQIFSALTTPTINFQTQALSNAADFDIVFPASTVGYFRHVGFTLIGSGKIKAIFSPEVSTEGALANPGGYFVSGGLPIGYITLECTNVAGYFKTAGSATDIIENAKIFRFGSGAGGGSSTGDANSFTENLKHRLVSSFYEYVTPVVFEIDEETLTTSATATYDLVDGVYSYTAGGQNFISKQLFDAEFLANSDDSLQLELHAEWLDSTSRDDAAIYEASIDGSAYETITMARQGLSQKFTGNKLLAVPANVTLSTQASTDGTTELNATTIQSFSAPIALATKNAARQIVIELNKLGSPVGSYVISLCEDSSGVPGSVLFSTIALASSLSAGTNVITLNSFRSVLPIGTYHIKIETDATYKAGFSAGVNSVRLNTNSGGNDLVYNGATWSAGSTDLKYTLSGHGYDLRIKVTSSASGKKLKSFGVFYDEQVGSVITGVEALQKYTFSGDLNTTSFTVTRFLPNPAHMKVYDIGTGQVYRHPAFNIDGHTVTFASGTFLTPGQVIELIFDQSEGSGFDNSDTNANLLAANHLGSTDATLDKSVSGRGILIRNAAGVMKELWLDASNNLNITDPL